jgi:hypothetical protein
MKRKSLLALITALGLFYSCEQSSSPAADAADAERAARLAMMYAGDTPDSLRSPEQRALVKNLEMILFERCSIKDNRFEIGISKKEFKAIGVPQIYYDILKKDAEDLNRYLDTVTVFPVELMIDAFKESRDEYFAAKAQQNVR